MQGVIITICLILFFFLKFSNRKGLLHALRSAPSVYRTDIYAENQLIFYLLYIGIHIPAQEIIMRGLITGGVYRLLDFFTYWNGGLLIAISLLLSSSIFVYGHLQYKNKIVMLTTFFLSNYRGLDYLLHGSLVTVIVSHICFGLLRCSVDHPITKQDLLRIPMQLHLLKEKIQQPK